MASDFISLDEFIDIVQGGRFPFTFYDEKGLPHKVMITNAGDLKSTPTAFGYEGEITLELLFVE